MRNVWVLARFEMARFFDSLIAYLVLGVFLVGIGLFVWVLPGNVLEARQAQLDPLFSLAPWFYLFLIPALTMRSFAEEFKTGTLEFLATKPITDWQILLGKYLGSVLLVWVALMPTLLYVSTLHDLGLPPGNWDSGATWGAYLGLLGLGAVFAAVGIFGSTLASNQIVAFVASAFLCFALFGLFDFLAEMKPLESLRDPLMGLSAAEHYRSISRGVVDSRDVIYYASTAAFFLVLAKFNLVSRKGA